MSPPPGRPTEGSLPASLEQDEKSSREASAGATIRLGVDPRAKDARGAPRRVANIALGGKTHSGNGAPNSKWRDREEFKARVLEWAAKFGVEVRGLYVRPMQKKWASCSTNGTLSFNDELLGMERDLGDYVIVHELLHFSVPNHGKLWKSLMRAHLGEYEQLEVRMKHAAPDNRSRWTTHAAGRRAR